MKTIYFWNKKNGGAPFWQPWGCMGCLGRVLIFLILLLLLLLLLSLFRSCRDSYEPEPEPDPIAEWTRPIDDGEEVGLPPEDGNILPPFEETQPVPNPRNGGATTIYPNLLYVILDSESNDDTFRKFAQKFSSLYPAPEHKIVYYSTGSKTMVLNVPEPQRDVICERLPEQISEVEFYVIPVEVMTQNAPTAFNDPVFKDADKSWYLAPIQAQEAWEITKGSPDVIVGIVDSYMDLNHQELKGERYIYPYDVVNKTSNVLPPAGSSPNDVGHGTFVTSIAVGNANNNAGLSGIAPNCKFIPVSLGNTLNTITVVEGLLYCIYHGASVINISIGSRFSDEVVNMPVNQQIAFSEQYCIEQEHMFDYVFKLAEKRNVTIVWSAGNQHCFGAMDTAKRNPNTIRVAAVDRNLQRAEFSNFGNIRDMGIYESTISAPGVKIWGAVPGNKYMLWDGTSFAAPIITGVVALLKSQNKDLTTQQIIKILQSTGKPLSDSPEIGNLVQIKDALIKAKQTVASGNVES